MTAVAPARVTPNSAADVASELARCNRDGAAVVAVGGATLQTIGNAPARCDVALHLGGLRGIVDYDPRDMTAGIAAGTTLADVARTLGENGQWIPFDAPHPDRATVGGTLAAGWAGPRRAVYGRPRDLVIGSTVALTDGSLAHAGGMVVKNVTGYDMSKIYIGSLGTLGVIVRANLKALPRPAVQRLAIAAVGEDVRDRAVGALGALTLEPAAALVIDGFRTVLPPRTGGLNLAVLFAGSEAVVDRATRDLRSALGRAGIPATRLIDGPEAERVFADIVNAYVETLAERSITFRSPGLPSTAWARTRAFHTLAAEAGLVAESIADVRTGDAVVRLSSRQRGAIGEAIVAFERELRATLERATILAGAAALRAKIDAWGPPPTTIGTMRALKARFDPTGILAPGRYVGAI